MAGRFLFQEFASGVSRSTSRLSGHVPASARATAPVTPRASEAGITTLSNVFHRAAVHPGTVFPSNRGLHGCVVGGITTLTNLLHGAAVNPGMVVPTNYGIHGYAARYLSTFPWSRASAKTGWSTTGMPPSITNQKKSAFLNSVGVKRTFSSDASSNLEHSMEVKRADWKLDFILVWMSAISLVLTFCLPLKEERRRSPASSVCCNCMAGGSKSFSVE